MYIDCDAEHSSYGCRFELNNVSAVTSQTKVQTVISSV